MPHGELYRFLFGVIHVAPLFLIVDNVRLRRLRRRRLEQDAERAVRALAGKVVIAGVELPLPDDGRWTETTCEYSETASDGVTLQRKAKLPALKIGPVIVGGQRMSGTTTSPSTASLSNASLRGRTARTRLRSGSTTAHVS